MDKTNETNSRRLWKVQKKRLTQLGTLVFKEGLIIESPGSPGQYVSLGWASSCAPLGIIFRRAVGVGMLWYPGDGGELTQRKWLVSWTTSLITPPRSRWGHKGLKLFLVMPCSFTQLQKANAPPGGPSHLPWGLFIQCSTLCTLD